MGQQLAVVDDCKAKVWILYEEGQGVALTNPIEFDNHQACLCGARRQENCKFQGWHRLPACDSLTGKPALTLIEAKGNGMPVPLISIFKAIFDMKLIDLANGAVVRVLPYFPDLIVKNVAKPYIAGNSLEDVLAVGRKLSASGINFTVNILGEEERSEANCVMTDHQYMAAIEVLAAKGMGRGVAVKLSQIGLGSNGERREICLGNLRKIVDCASELGKFVRIDMENSAYTDNTISIWEGLAREYPNLGLVLQAYLRRSRDDLKRLLPMKPNVRVCKGIYIEPGSIAFKEGRLINESFLELVELLLANGCHAAVATHDESLIAKTKALISRYRPGKDGYEFQALLGVKWEMMRNLALEGHPLTIYIPFGPWDQSRSYSERRMRENPKIAEYVIKAIFKKQARL